MSDKPPSLPVASAPSAFPPVGDVVTQPQRMTWRCRVGLHRRGPYERVIIHHLGEWPWDSWHHYCFAYKRPPCQQCGKPSVRALRKCSAFPVEQPTGPHPDSRGGAS